MCVLGAPITLDAVGIKGVFFLIFLRCCPGVRAKIESYAERYCSILVAVGWRIQSGLSLMKKNFLSVNGPEITKRLHPQRSKPNAL